jgi:hypothetical protein
LLVCLSRLFQIFWLITPDEGITQVDQPARRVLA